MNTDVTIGHSPHGRTIAATLTAADTTMFLTSTEGSPATMYAVRVGQDRRVAHIIRTTSAACATSPVAPTDEIPPGYTICRRCIDAIDLDPIEGGPTAAELRLANRRLINPTRPGRTTP